MKKLITNPGEPVQGSRVSDYGQMESRGMCNNKVIGVSVISAIGAGIAGIWYGYYKCEKKYKPVVEDLETRVKKLEKRTNV